MTRFHVHLGVADLEQSIRFYSDLFGAPPSVRKDDYAKWMIEDPRGNFATSTRGGELGINHLGLQADSACCTPAQSTAEASQASCCTPAQAAAPACCTPAAATETACCAPAQAKFPSNATARCCG